MKWFRTSKKIKDLEDRIEQIEKAVLPEGTWYLPGYNTNPVKSSISKLENLMLKHIYDEDDRIDAIVDFLGAEFEDRKKLYLKKKEE